jgi:hypothetical protein
MTRLRVKGAAQRNSLYQLTNGYVTIAQTVKVRPGTFRHTNLGATSGLAGKTFGLTYFDGSFHIFASEELSDIPDGYTLHVLNHPAVQQELTGQIKNFTLVAGNTNSGAGYAVPPDTYTCGSLTPPTFVDGNGVTRTVCRMVLENTGLLLKLSLTGVNIPQLTTFNYITIVDQGGTTHTLTAAAATYNGTDDTNQASSWSWVLSGAVWLAAHTYSPLIGITAPGTFAPIPLKEIHFSAPFMGFLYVAAEFDVDSATREAWGDTYHYWIQTSGEWTADTVYQIGQIVSPTVANGFQYMATRISSPNPGWTANTPEVIDNIVEPTTPNGYYFTVIEVDGANPLTGATEPTWPTSTGATVAEDTTVGGNDVVASAAPQPATNVPSAGTGTKYTNPYTGPSKSL